jgi:hypothetical protein
LDDDDRKPLMILSVLVLALFAAGILFRVFGGQEAVCRMDFANSCTVDGDCVANVGKGCCNVWFVNASYAAFCKPPPRSEGKFECAQACLTTPACVSGKCSQQPIQF